MFGGQGAHVEIKALGQAKITRMFKYCWGQSEEGGLACGC